MAWLPKLMYIFGIIHKGLFHGTQNGLAIKSCAGTMEVDQALKTSITDSYMGSNFSGFLPTPSVCIKAVWNTLWYHTLVISWTVLYCRKHCVATKMARKMQLTMEARQTIITHTLLWHKWHKHKHFKPGFIFYPWRLWLFWNKDMRNKWKLYSHMT